MSMPPPVTGTETEPDTLLRAWQERLVAVTRNTNELSEAEFTKRIRHRLREGRYAGLTRARAEAALDDLSSLMDDYLLLARVIDAAVEASKAGLFSSRDARHAKVLALLEGTSIQRPSVRVPLQQRDLLGAAQPRDALTPQALLTTMQEAFRQACDALSAIDAAEQQSAGDLAELRRDYAAMAQRADVLQAATDRPSFVELQDLQSDPLGTRDGLAALRRGLQAWSLRLTELEQVRATAQAGVALARDGLAELQRLLGVLDAEVAAVRDLFGDEAAAALQATAPAAALQATAPAALGMLTSWCDAIDNGLRAHEWHAVNVGLSRFRQALDAETTKLHRHIAAAQARRAEVAELQGRLRALKAKEHALRSRSTRPASCSERRADVEAALALRPLDLAEVRSALTRYQDELLAAGRP
ncbi:MAG: hypothetical protein AB3X44_07980 [Leptothrix sp. (in: b-proteobacteria)]